MRILTLPVIDVELMQFLMLRDISYAISATIGFAVGLILNFFLHTHLTFKAVYSTGTLIRFIVVLINYLLMVFSVALSNFLIDAPILGRPLSLSLKAANGFLLSKSWVYKNEI